jgi:hypothetical protein
MQVLLVDRAGQDLKISARRRRSRNQDPHVSAQTGIEMGSEFVDRCSEEGASSGMCRFLLSDTV